VTDISRPKNYVHNHEGADALISASPDHVHNVKSGRHHIGTIERTTSGRSGSSRQQT
jgi:hypothetical protein